MQQTAAKLRAGKGTNLPSRDASPLLTVFKHQLRDWIASQLPRSGDPGKIEAGPLNASLKEAGLFGPECSQQDYQSGKCDAENSIGELCEIKVSRPQGYPNALLIQTGVGILCGCDESTYLYEWRSGGWSLPFVTEQNDYDGSGTGLNTSATSCFRRPT